MCVCMLVQYNVNNLMVCRFCVCVYIYIYIYIYVYLGIVCVHIYLCT